MATWYIDADNGDDGNAGTSPGAGNAFETLAAAISAGTTADTIECAVATALYSISGNQNFSSKSFTVKGSAVPSFNPATNTWTAAIFSAGGAGTCGWITFDTSNPLIVEDLVFTDFVTSDNVSLSFFHSTPAGSRFVRCIFHNATIAGGSSVQECLLSPAFDCLVVGCLIYDCGNTSNVFGGRQNDGELSSALTLVNNVIYDCTGIFGTRNGPAQFYVNNTNNIFYNSDGITSKNIIGSQISSTIILNTYDYNASYQMTGEGSGTGNIDLDSESFDAEVLFEDRANWDFHLKAIDGSNVVNPLINAGATA